MKKQVNAIGKFIRISPKKLRRVVKCVKGLPLEQMIPVLKNLPQRGSDIVLKVLNSAIANAVNNEKIDKKKLIVKSIIVNEGPRFSRFQAKARGRVCKIIKRTSHVMVTVSELEE